MVCTAVLNYNISPTVSGMCFMRKLVLLVAAASVLGGCGEAGQNAVSDAVQQQLRSGFVQAAAEQCLNRIPEHPLIDGDKAKEVCNCTADKLVNEVSAADLSSIIDGNIGSEIGTKIQTAAMQCLTEMSGMAGETAASAAQ
ncbi:hypothetical protein D0T90_07690 [Neisseria animalis]|uniref:Uncharacterized protein n=2 Tax=Neisseria animalis TaxID=492 RepID=A0A5P3MUD1_NEIAN|nr:hypothetical protein D0T90_07690 [Neisseria animalis]